MFIWGSILSWLVVPPFLSNVLTLYEVNAATYFGVANEVLASSLFWWYLIIATMIAILPVIAIRIAKNELKPSLLEDVKLCDTNKRYEEIVENLKKQFHREDSSSSGGTIPAHWRSGYAFAHEEGFGTIISSGRYLGALATEVEQERVRRTNTWMRGDRKPKKKQALIESSLTKGLEAGLSVALAAGTTPTETIEETKEPPKNSTPPVEDDHTLSADNPTPLVDTSASPGDSSTPPAESSAHPPSMDTPPNDESEAVEL